MSAALVWLMCRTWQRKVGEMKLLPENVKVLYIASNCVEPYVEVRLVLLYSGFVQMFVWSSSFHLSWGGICCIWRNACSSSYYKVWQGLTSQCFLLQIIRVKDSKRRLSLCSSEDSEAEEPEYQEEESDALLVLSKHSQLLDAHDLEQVSSRWI